MSLEEQLRERFLLQGIASGPARAEQITALEQRLALTLPAAYRAYLQVCGTHPPQALVGSDCTISEVSSNTDYLIDLLAEKGVALPELPAVAFLVHQGYFVEYFLIDGSEDPEVFSYREGDPEIKRSYSRFSEWVSAIPGHMAL